MTVSPESFHRHRAAVRDRLLRAGHVRPGADSVTWNVNREMIVIAGWGRAILLQLAHPAIAAGVRDHSGLSGRLRASGRRMRSTVGAMLSITFGDTEKMIAAAAVINAIHDRVRGPIGDGPPGSYSAHDPHLQRWVHATLVESILLTYEALVGSLTVDDRNQFCADATIMEPLMGMPAGWLPRTSAELDAYTSEMLAGGRLVVTDTSRTLARAMLYPKKWYWGWPAFRPVQLLTIGTLPPSIRAAYGFEWRARDQRAFVRWTTALRASLRLLPSFARHWPMSRPQCARTMGSWLPLLGERRGAALPSEEGRHGFSRLKASMGEPGND